MRGTSLFFSHLLSSVTLLLLLPFLFTSSVRTGEMCVLLLVGFIVFALDHPVCRPKLLLLLLIFSAVIMISHMDWLV